MQITKVLILAKNDPPAELPEYKSKVVHDVRLNVVSILEAGMESGRCSVMLMSELPDGSLAAIQLSAGQFDQIAGAVRGACLRFGEELSK